MLHTFKNTQDIVNQGHIRHQELEKPTETAD